MFKRNYYCLVAGLSDIIIDGKKPGETSHEFKNELAEQLLTSDYKLAELLYLNYDNKNLLNLILKQDKRLITFGNYTEEYLEEQIKEPTNIVDYMKQLIINFKAENQVILPPKASTTLRAETYNRSFSRTEGTRVSRGLLSNNIFISED